MKLLVTVISSAEARQVADLADLVDVKDPTKGSLGAPDYSTVHGIRTAIGTQSPLSVALGNLDQDNLQATVELGRLMAGAGATMLKIGLAGIEEPLALQTLKELKRALSVNVQVAAVAYADGGELGFFPPFALAGAAKEAGLDGVMVDTWNKESSKGLLDHITPSLLKSIITDAKNQGLKTALAGKLDMDDIDQLASIDPDWIGFRSAITQAGERGDHGINRDKVNKLKIRIRLAMKKAR